MSKRNIIIGAIAAAVVVLIVVLVLVVGRPAPETPAPVTVGCKGFTEQLIIGEMMAQLLEDRLEDVNVELVDGLSTSALRDGIEAGDLDIVAEYTGTAWLVHFGQEYEAGIDNNELYQSVKEGDEANNINWLDPIWNNNTYAFASWSNYTEAHNLTTLSDLAALYEDMEGMIDTSITIEWDTRPDGRTAFEEHYGFTYDPASLLIVEAGLTAGALENEQVDVGMVFGTDSIMAELGWHVYQDDLSFFPPYDMTPSVRAEVSDEYPEIVTILNELVATFPGGGQAATPATVGDCQTVWQELNHKVDFGGMFPDEVAAEYLQDQGLI
jgi:osmoprotectant transport system substrate-binding protein